MASTVKPSTFQVKIKEDHVINGIRTVNENYYRIPDVTNYDRRIVTCPNTTSVDLINTNGPTPGPALFPSSSIAYGRITNMDDAYRLAVSFTSSLGLTGVLYKGKDLFPTLINDSGRGGTAGTFQDVPQSSTSGVGSGAEFTVTTGVTAGFLTPTSTLGISQAATATINATTAAISATSTSGNGIGAKFTIRSSGGNIDAVNVATGMASAGSGYANNDTITFSAGFLTGLGTLGTVNQDVVVRIATADLLVRPESIIVAKQGKDYAVGDVIVLDPSNMGDPAPDLNISLVKSDFVTSPDRNYWTMECLPTSSIMFSSPNCSGSDFIGSFDQDIEFISVYAISSSIDVEYVLVNAPVATN